MKKYILFDHDGVLVDTEYWYYKSAERALGDIGFELDGDQYLLDMAAGRGSWAQITATGVAEDVLAEVRAARNQYYQEYLRTKPIEIDGVLEILEGLAQFVSMAIVTTSKRADFELIHEHREITRHMEFVLVREDYTQAKPHPEPYLEGLSRFGAPATETLVVEDSARGLQSAVAAGIDCVVVHNDFTSGQDLTLASARIRTLRELDELVRNWR